MMLRQFVCMPRQVASSLLFLALICHDTMGSPDECAQVQGILREGDILVQAGRIEEGARKYQEAYARLEKVKKENPDWEPLVVKVLLKQTSEKLGSRSPMNSDVQDGSSVFIDSVLAGNGLTSSATPPHEKARILDIQTLSNREDVPLNEDKIRQNMRSCRGGLYSPDWVNEDIANLYSSGDFKNIQIRASPMRGDQGENGIRLTVVVEPKVPLGEWDVERLGKNESRDRRLSVALQDLPTSFLQIGKLVDLESLHRQAKAWEEIYRKRGFFKVSIRPKVTPWNHGKDRVVMEISEGERAFVRQIQFIGNKKIDSKELKKLVKLKPRKWFFRGDPSDCMEDGRLEQDLAQLKNFYLKKGFLDVKIEASVNCKQRKADRTAKKEGEEASSDLVLVYRIEEGDRYGVEKVIVEGANFFRDEDLLKVLREKSGHQEVFDPFELKMVKADGLLRGHPFSELGLQASVETLHDFYGMNGFREARIETRVQGGERQGALVVIFQIQEGGRFFVGRVQIIGNTQVPDRMIRNKVELVPGDVFDTEKEKQSKEKILDMGAFSSVETYAQETDRNNIQDLIIKVEEKRKELSFGIGLSYFWKGKGERAIILAYQFPYLITLNYSQDWGWVWEKMMEAMKNRAAFYLTFLKSRALRTDPAI